MGGVRWRQTQSLDIHIRQLILRNDRACDKTRFVLSIPGLLLIALKQKYGFEEFPLERL